MRQVSEASASKLRGARQRLDRRQWNLLFFLWQRDVRRIDYRRLRRYAEVALGSFAEQLDRRIQLLGAAGAELEEKLDRGVYLQGQRKGKRYSAATRDRKLRAALGVARRRSEAAGLRRELDEIDDSLEGLLALKPQRFTVPKGPPLDEVEEDMAA